MDNTLSEILGRLPPKPPRSRLDPHAALIEELRRRGRTYREIARVLAEDCQVQSSPSNIYYFVRLRAREAKQAKQELGSSKIASAQTTVRNTAAQGNLPNDVAQRIATLKQRKIPQPTSAGFHFNPDEPLRLITEEKPVSNK